MSNFDLYDYNIEFNIPNIDAKLDFDSFNSLREKFNHDVRAIKTKYDDEYDYKIRSMAYKDEIATTINTKEKKEIQDLKNKYKNEISNILGNEIFEDFEDFEKLSQIVDHENTKNITSLKSLQGKKNYNNENINMANNNITKLKELDEKLSNFNKFIKELFDPEFKNSTIITKDDLDNLKQKGYISFTSFNIISEYPDVNRITITGGKRNKKKSKKSRKGKKSRKSKKSKKH